MPKLLNIYNFELWYCFCGDINGRGGQFVLLKIQQKSQTCKVRNASCHFWKIYNSRSLVNRPTGERSWKGRWCFGWVSSNKQWFGIISMKYSSHKCKGTFVPNMLKIFIGQTTCLLFSPMPIVLFRPLFEIFEQEWIPWFELHVVASDTVWCHGKQSVQAVMRHMVIKKGRQLFSHSWAGPFGHLWSIFGCWCLFGCFGTKYGRLGIRSDASDVFSASMSQRSDLQDPKKGRN